MTNKTLTTQFNELLYEITKKTGNYDISDKYTEITTKQRTFLKTKITQAQWDSMTYTERDSMLDAFYEMVIPELRKLK